MVSRWRRTDACVSSVRLASASVVTMSIAQCEQPSRRKPMAYVYIGRLLPRAGDEAALLQTDATQVRCITHAINELADRVVVAFAVHSARPKMRVGDTGAAIATTLFNLVLLFRVLLQKVVIPRSCNSRTIGCGVCSRSFRCHVKWRSRNMCP